MKLMVFEGLSDVALPSNNDQHPRHFKRGSKAERYAALSGGIQLSFARAQVDPVLLVGSG
jgi:hypothetical protein